MAAVTAAASVLLALPPQGRGYDRPGRTKAIDVTYDGAKTNDFARGGAISADGRYVLFNHQATNIVAGLPSSCSEPCGSHPEHVYVRDRTTAKTEHLVAGHGQGISRDGRYVVFSSEASDLVAGDTNGNDSSGMTRGIDVFVFDRLSGGIERVSVSSDGAQGNRDVYHSAISGDGRYVAFMSDASNLVPGDTNEAPDVFVHDRVTRRTERVSVSTAGEEADAGVEPAGFMSLSADGCCVAWTSNASDLVAGDTNGGRDVFVRDRRSSTTERVSLASDGSESPGGELYPSLSGDGRLVSFASGAALVPGDTNGFPDVYVRDRKSGTTERVSVASQGSEGDQGVCIFGGCLFPFSSMSADGRHVAFESAHDSLVPGDTNGRKGAYGCTSSCANQGTDVFVYDRVLGVTERVSVAGDGSEADNRSGGPSISADGGEVAFGSFASNLVAGHGGARNGGIYVRSRGPAIGPGGLSAARQGVSGPVSVSGWAVFSGVVVAQAQDPVDSAAQARGADLLRAAVVYRPEKPGPEDLLLRLELSGAPYAGGDGSQTVLYAVDLAVGSQRYRVQVLRPVSPADPTAKPSFGLYACRPECTQKVAALEGGYGSTGDEVRVALPRSLIGVGEGSSLTGLRAFTQALKGVALPDGGFEAIETTALDEVALADATLPGRSVAVGIAAAGTTQDRVLFSPAALSGSDFAKSVDVSSLPPGDYEVWARACLGGACGADLTPLRLEPYADLSLGQSDTPDPVKAGRALTYTIVARNASSEAGASSATGVLVSDDLPASLSFLSVATTKGTCTRSGQAVRCQIGSLAKGQSATVTLKVKPTLAGQLANTASVRGVEGDPLTANNSETAYTTVNK